MTQTGEVGPTFARPPVVETRLSVQFAPLLGFRAAHFGGFWRHCLGSDWRPVDEVPAQQHQVERFDSSELNPTPADATEWMADSVPVQAVFRSSDEMDTVLFQPDRLTYRCSRNGGGRSYREIRDTFDPIMTALNGLVEQSKLNLILPDLWELNYLNVIPQGELWQTPADWHRVLPGLFVAGMPAAGSEVVWTSFNGDWYFELPDRAGRLRFNVSKSVSNQTRKLVLLLNVRASGPVGPAVGHNWANGMDLGHRQLVAAFAKVASPEALNSWGYSS